MNLLLLFKSDFAPGSVNKVRLHGERCQSVLALPDISIGTKIQVGLVNGKIGIGFVTKLTDSLVELDIKLYKFPPEPLPVTLLLALPRPQILKRVLQSVTTQGIKQIVLLSTSRVEKSYWQSSLLKKNNMLHYIFLGLEQSVDTFVPNIILRPGFRSFVEDELPKILKDRMAIIAHPSAKNPCPYKINQPAVLAVGPEAGFSSYEVELLEDKGFISVNIGSRILKVDSAVTVLLAKLFC